MCNEPYAEILPSTSVTILRTLLLKAPSLPNARGDKSCTCKDVRRNFSRECAQMQSLPSGSQAVSGGMERTS